MVISDHTGLRHITFATHFCFQQTESYICLGTRRCNAQGARATREGNQSRGQTLDMEEHVEMLPVIRETVLINAPIERVWSAVATSEGLTAWFVTNDFQPVVGHEFTLDAGPWGHSRARRWRSIHLTAFPFVGIRIGRSPSSLSRSESKLK